MHSLQYAVWGAPEWGAALHPRADAPAKLRDIFAAQYGKPVLAVNAARVALTLSLQAFGHARPGAHLVLVPAYICPAVMQAVRAAGCVPMPVAVGPDLNLDVAACRAVLARFAVHVRAVVLAHMYACPAQVAAFEALCREAGVYLIDDAAHAPGVASDGRLMGAGGDVGLASFAQSKTLTAGVRGSGGLLIVNNPRFADALACAVSALPVAAARVAGLCHFALHYLGPPWLARAASRVSWRLPARDHYAPARIAPIDAAIALAQWQRLDALIAARTRVLGWYAQALQSVPGAVLPQFSAGRYLSRVMVQLRQPAFVPAIRAQLFAQGVATREGYSDVCGALIELPLSVTMCADDVARVCESLRLALSQTPTPHRAPCTTSHS